jgi:hypothetical protein
MAARRPDAPELFKGYHADPTRNPRSAIRRGQPVTDDFRDIVRLLTDSGVRFLVVGAHALAAHGVPRVTGDLDLWVEATPANASRVWSALAAFGAPAEALGLKESDFSTPDVVAQIGLPPGRIDLMTGISGLKFGEAWGRRMPGDFLGVAVNFLSRDDFIANKRASGRRKDLDDIEALEGR